MLLVEQSPPGYPQFSRLIGAHPDFCLSPRFSNARARILLQKQQIVESLEKKLEELDAEEQPALWLGSFEDDGSKERRVVLGNLDTALKDYGMFHDFHKYNLFPLCIPCPAILTVQIQALPC